jgi:hypothetical protein
MKGEHILHSLNPFGKDLKSHTEDLVMELCSRINIPLQVLNFTEESIYALDNHLILRKTEIDEGFVNENLIPICVYLNETYVRSNGGRWFMELDAQTWQPVVMTLTGDKRQYFSYIYENLMFDGIVSINSCYFSGGSPV